MDWYIVASILIGGLLVLVVSGLPVAAALGGISLIFLFGALGIPRGLVVIGNEFVGFWSHYDLLPIPLFIFMGEFLFAGGTASDIFDIASKWLRRLPGGLAVATTGACAMFATLSGSSVGATATFGILAVPEMLRRGYSHRLACGSVAAAGGLAHLIPPSVMAVIYASLTEMSAGRMMMAGLIPGFILAFAYAIVCMVWAWKNPSAAPTEPPVSWKERVVVLRKGAIPLVLMLVVLGSIYSGAATVTEAAGLGALGAFLISLVSRKLTWQVFRHTMLSTLKTSGFIMFLAVTGKFLSWVLSYYMIPQNLVRLMVEANFSPLALVGIMQIVYVIMGMFIDGIGMTVITVPILLPIFKALGIDPIWFGVLLFINLEVALVSPPLGLNLYIIQGVSPQVKLKDIMYGAFTFNIADFSVLALVLFVPQLALWLPSKMYGG